MGVNRSSLLYKEKEEMLPDIFRIKRLSTGMIKVVINIRETNTTEPAGLNPIGKIV